MIVVHCTKNILIVATLVQRQNCDVKSKLIKRIEKKIQDANELTVYNAVPFISGKVAGFEEVIHIIKIMEKERWRRLREK